MSTWLFNIYLDVVAKKALPLFKGGVSLNNCQVQVTIFADDNDVLMAKVKKT